MCPQLCQYWTYNPDQACSTFREGYLSSSSRSCLTRIQNAVNVIGELCTSRPRKGACPGFFECAVSIESEILLSHINDMMSCMLFGLSDSSSISLTYVCMQGKSGISRGRFVALLQLQKSNRIHLDRQLEVELVCAGHFMIAYLSGLLPLAFTLSSLDAYNKYRALNVQAGCR